MNRLGRRILKQRRNHRISGKDPNGKPLIEIHIEALVPHGFSSGDRYAIGDAVEQDLTRSWQYTDYQGSGMKDIPLTCLIQDRSRFISIHERERAEPE